MARTKTPSRQRTEKKPAGKNRSSKRLAEARQRRPHQSRAARPKEHLDKDRDIEIPGDSHMDPSDNATMPQCVSCAQLKAYADRCGEGNTLVPPVCGLPTRHEGTAVSVDLRRENKEGLLRWHPPSAAWVLLGPDGALRGLRIYDRSGLGEDEFKTKVLDALAFSTRFGEGTVDFQQPPTDELDGFVLCEHFEDGVELQKQLAATADLMALLASRR
ncbi:hypothetical protein CPB85DRAFT_1427313 [Mucidula mucida]|nr:hypothetical protein CPB85DRAFT_1427313 [Mucidula mucida]